MGFPCFSKICRYGMLAAVGLAAAAVAVIALAPPASAQDGGGGADPLFAWDTDNLLYTAGESSYSARTFGVPFHEYSGYAVGTETYRRPAGCIGFYDENDDPQQACWEASDVTVDNEPCQSGVADGFFQTVAGGRNDFPVLEITDPDGEETEEAFKDWETSRNSGCDEFSVAQDRLVSTVAANGGYYLDSHGNLAAGSLPAHVLSARSLRPARVGWDSRQGFWFDSGLVGTSTGYADRVDAGSTLAVSPSGTSLSVPPNPSWPATKHQNGNVSWSALTSFNSVGHLPLPMAIGGTQSGVWCPTGFHPRGEDGLQRVGRGSGRTLTSLASDAKIQQADKFWCRSDVRYRIGYKKQTHSQTCGASPRAACPSGVTLPNDRFSAYGRVNCYYTVISLDTANQNTCRYYHPIPQCTDSDSNAKREYTTQELATYTTGEKFPAKTDGTTSCGEATAAPPPQQAGFTADACVTASFVIAENRIAGSDAEPGVAASDRSLAAATGRTAWDLDVTSPHPLTASAPRDATAGSGDPDGCADGSEDRADHASAPGDAARSQSPAPTYAASGRTDTAAPPNDADGDINYTAAVKNLAHRYASRVAENTCAAKLAEAEAELSLLELREDAFAQWLSDYKTAADTNASRYSSYTRTPQQSGLGLAILRFNDYEANKATYAALLATRYTNLSSALAAAKAAYDTATDRTAGSSRAAVIAASSDSGCVAHYTAEITRLKTLFSNAETAAASRIRTAQTAIAQTRLATVPSVAITTTVNSYTTPDISAVESRRESSTVCLDIEYDGGCWRAAADGETCMVDGVETSNCPGRTRVEVTIYYTCPGGSYTVSGAVSGRYKTSTRSSSFSAAYAAAARGESTSSSCPNFAVQSGATYASGAAAYVRGTPGTASSLPSVASVAAPDTLRALSKASLLGSYYLSHGDRANLEATVAADRNTAGNSLSVSVGSVPSGSPQEIEDYQTAYKTAYDAAYSQAEGHMSGTSWDSFDWRYETSTLAWGNYQEDPATTYSASTATPRDGTGCDLISVASDGSVSVEATRLDYETSSYGKSSVYSTRTDAQRTCKIRRTRTPELLLMYAPAAPAACTSQTPAGTVCGTDTSKTVDTRLDTDTAASNAEFYYVDYQPPVAAGQPAAEQFKLYGEAEVFAVKTSLVDSPPTFCASNVPSTVYVSHAAGAMSDMSAAIAAGRLYSRISTEVLRPAGYSPSQPPTDHCFSGAFASAANVKIAVFDDTAHSAMNLVYLEKDPADTSGMTLLASGGALTADPAVAYPGDSAQSSSFYGTTYSMPASLGSTAGWDVLAGSRDPGDPYPLDTKVKNRIVARDKLAVPNLPAVPADTTFKHVSAMGFDIGFLDCRPDIENVIFVGNITNATQASNQANDYAGITSSSGYPMDAPPWYYPAWSDLKENTLGQPRIRTDGSTVAVGERSGIYTHPQSAQYGWVMETVNHISIDKQPISAFRNQPDVRRRGTTANPARPADVTLENHRQVCFGDRTAIPHYRSAAAATDPLGHNTDTNPQQAIIVWSAHNPICDTSNVCDTWETRCYKNVQTPAEAEQVDCPPTGQPLPADTTRFADKAMVDANIVRIISADDLSDTETAPARPRDQGLATSEVYCYCHAICKRFSLGNRLPSQLSTFHPAQLCGERPIPQPLSDRYLTAVDDVCRILRTLSGRSPRKI